MKKQETLKEMVRRIIREEKIREDFYDNRNKTDEDWQYDKISDYQVDYLEERINDEFGNGDYWYISFIDSFPKADDGSMLFIYCTTDEKPIKKRSFRCKNIEGEGLDIDGSLSSHERNSKTIWKDDN